MKMRKKHGGSGREGGGGVAPLVVDCGFEWVLMVK